MSTCGDPSAVCNVIRYKLPVARAAARGRSVTYKVKPGPTPPRDLSAVCHVIRDKPAISRPVARGSFVTYYVTTESAPTRRIRIVCHLLGDKPGKPSRNSHQPARAALHEHPH
jgi:hypothetical protein